jgi:serine/threonine-protein kinase
MSHSATCNPDIIDDFLADRLDSSRQTAFENHLDECDACCRRLQARTADVTLWNDARAYLSSTDNAARPGTEHLTTAADTPAPATEAPSLDFLAPTDDPHMLGRFAGYEISGLVGHGGMGLVLKGFDNALNRYAAIKVLAPHYASSGAARKRFAREAQAAAAVVHDNVIAIHGVDEFNSIPYLVMPYIKGESLQKRINREGALSVPEILRIAMQTARGLAAAHDQGLVHRDIKPANILLPENVERVMITDFGLARAADDASLTRSGVIAGTPQYMSPEQARGEGVDARSDLFSLGSVIYAMCTGHPPFRAETPYGILRRITDNDPRPIQEINSGIPRWLCDITNRLLAKNAADRFPSADYVANLLEDCLAHVQQPSVVPLPAELHPPVIPGWRRGPIITRACAVAALVAVVWFAAVRSSEHNTNQQPAAVNSDRSGDGSRTNPNSGQPTNSQLADSNTNQTQPSADDVDAELNLQWHTGDTLDSIESTLSDLNSQITHDLATLQSDTPAADAE